MPKFSCKVPMIARAHLCGAAMFMVTIAATSANAQDSYTGTPQYPVNDNQTIYDGIGTVTELPGGTSVLERVLYSLEKLNLGSPRNVVPVNGLYANIAESVAQRQWYSTDRTEVSFQNYVEDVTVTETEGLTWKSMGQLAAGDYFDSSSVIADPNDATNTATVADMEFMKISVFAGNTNNLSTIAYQGTNSYTFGEYAALTANGSIDLMTPYDPMGANVLLQPNGDLNYTGGSMGFLVLVVEVAGKSYLFDTLGSSGSYTGMGILDYSGPPYELSQLSSVPFVTGSALNLSSDLAGGSTAVSYPFSTVIADTSLVWVDADSNSSTPDVLQFKSSDYMTANSLTAAAYDYDVVTPTNFTRQLESFFEDWNQRDVATTIDGSVTNVISGVNDATAVAGTAGALLMQDVDVGNIVTTVLGAVNTGDIAVGVNSSANEATSSASRALAASMEVVGGSADTGSMMINVSHNSSVINGSVSNMLVAVNGSVGNIATTTLGAVNTGTISSGVTSAVQSIVGISN